jgi:hypothetical protein
VWGLQGSAGLSFTDSHLNFEGDLAYSHAAVHGFTQEQLHLGGNLVWWEPAWRIGASAAGHRIDVPGSVRETQNYGLYGVWFPSGSLTLMTKAGAFSGHAHGNYAGGGTNWYLTPDISLFGALDWARFDSGFREADWTASVQYLPSENWPVSVVAGYTRANFSGGVSAHADTVFIALRVFFNRSGETSLVGRERTGPIGWPASFGPQGIGF